MPTVEYYVDMSGGDELSECMASLDWEIVIRDDGRVDARSPVTTADEPAYDAALDECLAALWDN